MKHLQIENKLVHHSLSFPIIYSVMLPLIIMDLWVEIYHRTCFPLFKIEYVKRTNYIKIDRHKLKYLNFSQKLGCVYCGYTNGLIHYWSVIAGETEKYWCGIMHEKIPGFKTPEHHRDFAIYDDKNDFENKYLKNSVVN